jgi:hypothetical protein
MIRTPALWRIVRLALCCVATVAMASTGLAAERTIEARLIWGTNDEKSPDASHKPLEGEMAKKLRDLPFRWKNYFEVNKQTFAINDKEYKKVVMSKQCFIEVKDRGDSKVTVKLYGEGTLTRRVDKPLPKDETLTIGGDDKNQSAWFITVRPVNESKSDKKDLKPTIAPKAGVPSNTAVAKPAPAK